MDFMKAVLDKALGEDASHDFDKIDQTGWGWFFFFCFCFCRDYNAVCSHWSDRVRLIHPFFAFVEAAILAGHMIITRCADPDRESAINIDVDRLFSCYHHDHQHHDHNDRHHHDQYHYHIIKTTWNRLLGLKEEEEGDYDDVYGDYDPDAELLWSFDKR